jgi:rSAM/selenodomain-associated transferase 2/rSAM/selenodomain-associated transferase 1
MSGSPRLILFTRFPVAGQAKTRLIPELGPSGAAGLQRRLTLRAYRAARAAAEHDGLEFEIRFDGGDQAAMRNWLGHDWTLREQGQGDLGQRLARAFEAGFREGATAIVIIGADCPEITPGLLRQAFEELSSYHAVLGPANDGGYYLLGLKKHLPELFTHIAWGTETVLATSLEILRRTNVSACLLPPLTDIDRPEDLALWRRILDTEEKDLRAISVIIPSLNEAENITPMVSAAVAGQPHEIIVVDATSTDATSQLAGQAGATVLHSDPGRARQMNYGAARASGTVLLFLHADTLAPPDYTACVAELLAWPRVVAGAFKFKLRGDFAGKSIVERTTNLRSRWLQLPYGDQGLFLRRALFEELGGYAALPILEDYDFVRRLRSCGRIVTAPLAASTSGRRWQRLGLVRTTVINQLVLAGFRLGRHPEKLAAFYRASPATMSLDENDSPVSRARAR